MPWFCDHAGSPDDSRKRRQRCCLPPFVERGHPESRISWLDSPACTCPYQRFATPLRVVDAWLGVVVGRWPFDVELFHLLLRTGLSRRFHKPPLIAVVAADAAGHRKLGDRSCHGVPRRVVVLARAVR